MLIRQHYSNRKTARPTSLAAVLFTFAALLAFSSTSPSLLSRSDPSQMVDVDASLIAASCSGRFLKCPQNLLLYLMPWRRLQNAPLQARLRSIPKLAARRPESSGAAASSSPPSMRSAVTKTFKSLCPAAALSLPLLQVATDRKS